MAIDYLEPFRTTELEYKKDSVVDLEIQTSYDGSVNIITTSEDTLPRIVNSRQDFSESEVKIITRSNNNLDNVYTDETISKTRLIPSIEGIIPNLDFIAVNPGSGRLRSGGYKYFFKLKTSDGVESPVIEESRLVTVHSGLIFGKSVSHVTEFITDNSVQFKISDLSDKVYKYISVYYTITSGETETTVSTAYKIDRDYEILYDSVDNTYYCDISHTGYENDILVDNSEIIAEYSPIESVKTLDQKNSRLLLGNVSTTVVANDVLKTAALYCFVEKALDSKFVVEQNIYKGVDTINDTFANPSAVYYKLGYFPAETYEFAINFVFENGSVSNAYPITGFDNTSAGTIDVSKLGQDIGWANGTGDIFGLQNSKGVVRMQDKSITDAVVWPSDGSKNPSKIDSYTGSINTSYMVSNMLSELKALKVSGYFVSRRERVPDMLMEGLLTLAATAPVNSMYPQEATSLTFGMFLGYGLKGTSGLDNRIFFPVPGSAMPFSTEGINVGGAATDNSSEYFDGILYAPLPDKYVTATQPIYNKHYAFYSPDVTSDAAKAATLTRSIQYGIQLSTKYTQSIAYTENKINCTTGSVAIKYPYCANIHSATAVTTWGTVSSINYIADGNRTYAASNFTGRLDRQAALFLNSVITSRTHDDAIVLTKAKQRELSYQNIVGGTDGVAKDYIKFTPISSDPVYTNKYQQLLMTGVKYSPYLGIIIENDTALSEALTLPRATDTLNGYFTAYNNQVDMMPADGSTYLGAAARIYLNGSNHPLDSVKWKEKYVVDRTAGYSAISKRFKVDKVLDRAVDWRSAYLTGGDCYTGFYYQRVWRPGGIDGIPTASSPLNYLKDGDTFTRQGVNITNSGYAIGFPVRSKYNFAIRSEQKADGAEESLYGQDRIYTSSLPKDEVHGNRQAETSAINYGNITDKTVNVRQQYDSTIPYIKSKYDNRVVVSEISVTGEFENGYRNFRGLNFKDYDEELGEITAITSNGLYTYVVYKAGVSMIEISERSAITSEATNVNVYIASADVLPPKSTPILTTMGSQHMKSVVNTEGGVYGVDADVKKIWSVNIREKDIISDQRMQFTLNALITDDLKDIISSYESKTYEITFNFIYNDESQKSIVYNTRDKVWYGTTDMHKLYQFNIDDESLSLQNVNQTYGLYYPMIHKYDGVNNLDRKLTSMIDDGINNIYESYIEFVVKYITLDKFNLSNIIINGSGVPTSIDVVSDSINNYNVGPAAISVLGTTSNTVPLHTNVFMRDAVQTDLMYEDEMAFRRTKNASYKNLVVGDLITVTFSTLDAQQFRIADIQDRGAYELIILSHKISTPTTITGLYYGWKTPIRLSLADNLSGKTSITIPSAKQASLISASNTDAQNNYVNNANTKAYGRWIKLRLNFNGVDQVLIDSVITHTTLRYS